MKRFNIIIGVIDTNLKKLTATTGGISFSVFASIADLLIFIALSGNSLLSYAATADLQKYFKSFTIKQEKHEAFKLVDKSKLDTKVVIISQARQDGDMSCIEFH